jgi:hypothetical protein
MASLTLRSFIYQEITEKTASRQRNPKGSVMNVQRAAKRLACEIGISFQMLEDAPPILSP